NGSAQIAGDDEEWTDVRESADRLRKESVRVLLVPEERAAIYEDDGEFHPVRYVRALAGAAVAAGARISDRTRAIAVTTSEGRPRGSRISSSASSVSAVPRRTSRTAGRASWAFRTTRCRTSAGSTAECS